MKLKKKQHRRLLESGVENKAKSLPEMDVFEVINEIKVQLNSKRNTTTATTTATTTTTTTNVK